MAGGCIKAYCTGSCWTSCGVDNVGHRLFWMRTDTVEERARRSLDEEGQAVSIQVRSRRSGGSLQWNCQKWDAGGWPVRGCNVQQKEARRSKAWIRAKRAREQVHQCGSHEGGTR